MSRTLGRYPALDPRALHQHDVKDGKASASAVPQEHSRFQAKAADASAKTPAATTRMLIGAQLESANQSPPAAVYQNKPAKNRHARTKAEGAGHRELRGKQMKLDANPSVQKSQQRLERIRKPTAPEQAQRRTIQATVKPPASSKYDYTPPSSDNRQRKES